MFAVHAGIIDTEDHLRGKGLLDFKIPLKVCRLREHGGETKKARGHERRYRLGDGVEAPAALELRKQRLVGCCVGVEQASWNARSNQSIGSGERIQVRSVE